jgi:hypothetical protein
MDRQSGSWRGRRRMQRCYHPGLCAGGRLDEGVPASRSRPRCRRAGRAICAGPAATEAARWRSRARLSRSSSTPPHASPRTPGRRASACRSVPRNAAAARRSCRSSCAAGASRSGATRAVSSVRLRTSSTPTRCFIQRTNILVLNAGGNTLPASRRFGATLRRAPTIGLLAKRARQASAKHSAVAREDPGH